MPLVEPRLRTRPYSFLSVSPARAGMRSFVSSCSFFALFAAPRRYSTFRETHSHGQRETERERKREKRERERARKREREKKEKERDR